MVVVPRACLRLFDVAILTALCNCFYSTICAFLPDDDVLLFLFFEHYSI